jgi:Heterokaryon incompatibility protein (HET)
VNVNPASEDAFLLAHGWLQTCLKTHGSCPKPTGHFTPTRLLEISYVGNLRRLRLRTMEFGAEERYAALTYCWGGDGRFTTTTRTIRQHMIGISFQDLPPSLRDAVLVTEKLDLRLLWVDALCVVQDDKHDKALEISQMPSVYSHATITIAASRASRVGEGFLTERAALGKENPEKVFELPYRCPDGEMGSVVLIPRIRESTEPLDRRAWALQERLLSTRILEYGSLQTMLTCLHSERKNDLVDGWRDRTVMNNERSDCLFIEAFQTVLSHELGDSSSVSRRGNLKSPLGEWHQLVKIYTHRALTLPTDRLPAISGIAERYARILRDEYVCGLWRSTLPQELLWTRSALAELSSRPLEYQGPSWSWAAINSAVRLYSRAITKAFEVVECHVEPLSKDAKFGAVRSGYLKVRGYVRPVKWIRNSNIANTRQYDSFRRGDVAGPDAEIAASMTIDSLENEFTAKDQIESVNVFLLVVSEPSHGGMEGLVLRSLLNGVYSRLGVFHFSKWCLDRRAEESEESRSERFQAQLRWFCGFEPQEITII